jgi:hypothetical protein
MAKDASKSVELWLNHRRLGVVGERCLRECRTLVRTSILAYAKDASKNVELWLFLRYLRYNNELNVVTCHYT